MTTCKKYDRSSHQKSRFFVASKGIGLSLDICSREDLEGLLQNAYLMLELLTHKRNPLITTIADDSNF